MHEETEELLRERVNFSKSLQNYQKTLMIPIIWVFITWEEKNVENIKNAFKLRFMVHV